MEIKTTAVEMGMKQELRDIMIAWASDLENRTEDTWPATIEIHCEWTADEVTPEALRMIAERLA